VVENAFSLLRVQLPRAERITLMLSLLLELSDTLFLRIGPLSTRVLSYLTLDYSPKVLSFPAELYVEANARLDHMSFEIDRDPKKEPSLTEMAIKGLNDLYKATKESKEGFFVMVEASRIVCRVEKFLMFRVNIW